MIYGLTRGGLHSSGRGTRRAGQHVQPGGLTVSPAKRQGIAARIRFVKPIAPGVQHAMKATGRWVRTHSPLLKLIGKVAIVTSAMLVLAGGLLSLRSRPAAEPFTRVGGETSVETAIDASRFWLRPPWRVVITPADAGQRLMLGAAACAMVNDAPLLLSSPNRKRESLVTATINSWQTKATATNPARPDVIQVLNPGEVTSCLATGHPDLGGRLSLFEVPTRPGQRSQLPPLPRLCSSEPPGSAAAAAGARRCAVPAQPTLAPVVVFAAAISLSHPPDVAVGLALAAHMATSGQHVSLVVVPRYLEADAPLGKLLRSQSELVTGGIVLGQTPTLPDDTRALLRQMLTSSDRLGQLVSTLTAPVGLAVAILTLLGLFSLAAPRVAGLGADLAAARRAEEEREEEGKERNPEMFGPVSAPGTNSTAKGPSDQVAGLNGKRVTVWLRSGVTVTGTVEGVQVEDVSQRNKRADVSALTLWRLKDPSVEAPNGSQDKLEYVLVRVADIEVIGVVVQA
jgi:small nuclear ribonucleoprotein (snRNP)-like protein